MTLPLLTIEPHDLPVGESICQVKHRLRHPWIDTVPLPSRERCYAHDYDLQEDDPLVAALSSLPVEEVTMSDLFIGGGDHVVLRVMTFDDVEVVRQAMNQVTRAADHPIIEVLKELLDSDEGGKPFYFVYNGHLYLNRHVQSRNAVLWTGKTFKMIVHRKDDQYIPVTVYYLEEGIAYTGGYDLKDKIKVFIDHLNVMNAGVWRGRVNPEWVVGKDIALLDATYGYLIEVLEELNLMQPE